MMESPMVMRFLPDTSCRREGVSPYVEIKSNCLLEEKSVAKHLDCGYRLSRRSKISCLWNNKGISMNGLIWLLNLITKSMAHAS